MRTSFLCLLAAAPLVLGCATTNDLDAPSGTSDAGVEASVEAGPDANTVDAETDAEPDTGPTGCVSDSDCSSAPTTPVCDPTNNVCVGCLPENDPCPSGSYCSAELACEPGCADDTDCDTGNGDAGTMRCDLSRHVCVGCLEMADCPAGHRCDTASSECVADCNRQTCSLGCCNNRCVDVQTDLANCGSCGVPCSIANGTGTCNAGSCEVASCETGFDDCNGAASDGCEVELASNVDHCGTCNTACTNAGSTCVGGICTAGDCDPGFGDCDGNVANGCETELIADPNCGACKQTCANAHGTTSCNAGTCEPSCDTGWDDCDSNPVNGCESSLDSAAHCGACGKGCNPQNASGSCSGGVCQLGTCDSGFFDCNNQATDGCESFVASDPTNCGGCGQACSAANGTPSCASGICSIQCASGFANCDTDSRSNGCEAELATDENNCGFCSRTCQNGQTCDNGTCATVCSGSNLDCDGSAANGCETDVTSSETHCGACNSPCNASELCVNGSCQTATGCSASSIDCDGDTSNGCECAGTSCCSGGCAVVHDNGLGQAFSDCVALGTYNLDQAGKAADAWGQTGTRLTGSCKGPGSNSVVCQQTASECACWVYEGSNAGHVRLDSSCLCASSTDPTWN